MSALLMLVCEVAYLVDTCNLGVVPTALEV